ncbi:hypothetical protein GQ53DRAFT_752373 [Thozetella sp. PMI_491]|nr:hypothetical protein GQ53DRAFT_752373 [Thozetella sp. PMI_491]
MAPGNGNMLSPPGGMPDQNMPQTAFSYLSPHAAYSTPGYGNGTQVTSPAAPFMYQPVSHGYGAPGAPYLPTSQAYMYAMTPSPAVGPSTSGPLAEERTSEAGLENARAGNTA